MNAYQWIGSLQYSWSRVDIDWEAVDEIVELLLKDHPEKPNDIRVNSEERYGTCKCLALVFENNNYCKCCGQAIDWSEDV